MEKLDNIIYEQINLRTYERRVENILKDEKIQRMGLKIKKIGKTYYNYPIEMIQIGSGKKEIFIIGATHASEIITTDFITQLINNIPNIKEFDPNTFKLNIIPIQNPEGFDINTSLLENIKKIDFENKSKEYYQRYKIDSLIYLILKDLNNIDYNIENLKKYINNTNWKKLEKMLPKLEILQSKIKYKTTTQDLLIGINETQTCLENNTQDQFLLKFLIYLKELTIKKINLNQIEKLHQDMFKNIDLNTLKIRNKSMHNQINDIYEYNPKGSIINHDATGLFINLNSNQPENPGINIMKNNEIKYMTGTKSNLRNYYKGPVGLPCLNQYNFEYAIENQIIYNEIKKSQENCIATILYHSTGGMIYYKTNNEKFINYNTNLAQAYNEGITKYNNSEYKLIEKTSNTGYGDQLRKTFKGVLLIELSKMGGNPIGPYGDKKNIYNTINENISGINNLLKKLKKQL